MLLPFQKVFMADQTSVSVPLKDDFKEQQKKTLSLNKSIYYRKLRTTLITI